MNLHIVIDVAIGVLCIGLGMGIMAFISKRDIKIFESGLDRGRHVMKILLFISLFYVLALFRERMTGEMVAQTVGGLITAVGIAVTFLYKDREGDGK